MDPIETTLHSWIVRLCCVFAFLLPVSAKAASISLAALFLVCLVYKIKNGRFLRFSSPVMFFVMLFYMLHVTGLLYSTNFSYAGLDLQIKASFLLMPLFIDNFYFNKDTFRKITRSFVVGCTLYSMVLLMNAMLEYAVWKDISSFFYIDFSYQRHVAYLTLYINCALFFLFDEFLRKPGFRIKSRYFISFWILFLLIIATLLSSRMAVFATFISFTLYIFLNIRKTGTGNGLFLTAISAVLMIAVYFLITGSRNRFENALPPAAAAEAYPVASSSVKSNVRFTVWQNTLHVYASHPVLGTGTGDIKDELRKQYAKNNFREGLDFNLSPHNQFLHTLTALGIPGLLTLLWIFVLSLRMGIKRNDSLLIAFLPAVALNCTTEGILEKQDGVLFFIFFITLFTGRLFTQDAKSASI